MTDSIALPQALFRAMVDHALAERPLEACGLVAGQGGRPVRFYPAVNAARSPVRYELAPDDLLRITMEIEAAGLELWGIFHSHPQTEAYPSHTDIRLALYPEAVYLIASLADPDRPLLRAFSIDGPTVGELSVAVTV